MTLDQFLKNASFDSILPWPMDTKYTVKKCGRNPSLKLSLLLISGDVSLNPGPNVSCNMRFATTNLRSVRQKSAALSDLISSKQIDILAMTETRLSAFDTAACLADISPPGFSLFHCPRPSGGVAFLVRETFMVEIIHTPKFISLEAIRVLDGGLLLHRISWQHGTRLWKYSDRQ